MKLSNAIEIIVWTIAYENIIRNRPNIAHLRCFLPVSIFSATPALDTIVNAAITIEIIANGAAMYRSVPDMICRMRINGDSGVEVSLFSKLRAKGVLSGLYCSGIEYPNPVGAVIAKIHPIINPIIASFFNIFFIIQRSLVLGFLRLFRMKLR